MSVPEYRRKLSSHQNYRAAMHSHVIHAVVDTCRGPSVCVSSTALDDVDVPKDGSAKVGFAVRMGELALSAEAAASFDSGISLSGIFLGSSSGPFSRTSD